jgi:hypothetical protein
MAASDYVSEPQENRLQPTGRPQMAPRDSLVVRLLLWAFLAGVAAFVIWFVSNI